MKNPIKFIAAIVSFGLFASFVIAIGCMWFNYNNTDVRLRKQAEAQRGKVELCQDKMWKVLQQKAQVSTEYKDAFKEIYPQIIEGRYKGNGDGSLMKWVQEANPNFDTSMYKDLMQSIEVERTAFMRTQERMLDIIREHSTLIETYPSKWFISNTAPIEYTPITSSKTKAVMESGTDDDVDLFKR